MEANCRWPGLLPWCVHCWNNNPQPRCKRWTKTTDRGRIPPYGLKVVFYFRIFRFYCLPLSSLCKTHRRHWIHINVSRVSCGGAFNMLLVLLITFYFITIYGVVCVQLAHLSIDDWKDISIAHVIIIIKSEVSTFPIVFIFFRGCVPEMFVTSYSVTYCKYIPGKPGICFH